MRNRGVMKAIKVQLKQFAAAVNGPIEALRKEYDLAAKKLDKAAAKRIVHPNMAARKKSQLARLVHKRETAAKSAPRG